MGAKSRGNFPIGMYISQDAWDNMFPKEKKNVTESEEQGSKSDTNIDDSVRRTSKESNRKSNS